MATSGTPPVASLDNLPVALTVAEAAAVLRLSRTTVYELIRRWNATEGAEGLRAVRLGRSLRIPRIAVTRLLGLTRTAAAAGSGVAIAPMAQTERELAGPQAVPCRSDILSHRDMCPLGSAYVT